MTLLDNYLLFAYGTKEPKRRMCLASRRLPTPGLALIHFEVNRIGQEPQCNRDCNYILNITITMILIIYIQCYDFHTSFIVKFLFFFSIFS